MKNGGLLLLAAVAVVLYFLFRPGGTAGLFSPLTVPTGSLTSNGLTPAQSAQTGQIATAAASLASSLTRLFSANPPAPTTGPIIATGYGVNLSGGVNNTSPNLNAASPVVQSYQASNLASGTTGGYSSVSEEDDALAYETGNYGLIGNGGAIAPIANTPDYYSSDEDSSGNIFS